MISIRFQVRALAGKIILWAKSAGSHPLQIILQIIIKEMSYRKWGTEDFVWVFTPCQTRPTSASTAVSNLCVAWNLSKPHITHRSPASELDVSALSLWSRNICHAAQATVGCKSNQQRLLKEAGLINLGDVTNQNGTIMTWDEIHTRPVPRIARRAYLKLTSTLTRLVISRPEAAIPCSIFVTNNDFHNRHTVWEFWGCRSLCQDR